MGDQQRDEGDIVVQRRLLDRLGMLVMRGLAIYGRPGDERQPCRLQPVVDDGEIEGLVLVCLGGGAQSALELA